MKRVYSFLLFVLCSLMLVLPALAAEGGDNTSGELLSPGMLVIARQSKMTLGAPRGDSILFSAEDFRRVSGMQELNAIEITARPDAECGQLMLGTTVLTAGQRVTAASLGYMSFVPTSLEVREASFEFKVEGSAYEYSCSMVFYDGENAPPSAEAATAAGLGMNTYEGMKCSGVLPGSDPDGDGLYFEISKYPDHGSVLLDGESGRYVYAPKSGYTGKDRFEYSLVDSRGKRSAESVRIELSVDRYFAGESFCDLKNDGSYALARRVSSKGLMSGVSVGGENYFYPEQHVRRGEFLVMAMNAAGIGASKNSTTVYADNADIPEAMRPYVAAATEMGAVHGWMVDGKHCFMANEEISVSEATYILTALLGISDMDVPASAGGAELWSGDSLSVAVCTGVLPMPIETANGRAALTRIDCAAMLAAVMRHVAN